MHWCMDWVHMYLQPPPPPATPLVMDVTIDYHVVTNWILTVYSFCRALVMIVRYATLSRISAVVLMWNPSITYIVQIQEHKLYETMTGALTGMVQWSLINPYTLRTLSSCPITKSIHSWYYWDSNFRCSLVYQGSYMHMSIDPWPQMHNTRKQNTFVGYGCSIVLKLVFLVLYHFSLTTDLQAQSAL